MCPVARCRRGLRRDPSGSALPRLPQSVSRGARLSRLHWFANCYGLSGCSPPWTDRTKFPWSTGDFYIQASDGSVALPAAGYHYNSHWTPLLAGLSPAGMAASLAAPNLGEIAHRWALEGHGIVLRSFWDVAAGLREGKLERVLPDYSQEPDVWGVYPTRLARSPKVRLFVSLLVEHFEELGSAQARTSSDD